MRKGKTAAGGWMGRVLGAMNRLLVAILSGANLMALLALWACALCTFVSPSTSPQAGIYCLAFPLLLAANLLFVPIWMLARWRMAAVPVVGVLMVWPLVQSYSPMHMGSGTPHADSARIVRVMQYNPHNFIDLNPDDSTNMLFRLLERDTFDIIAMQEASMGGRTGCEFRDFMSRRGYTILHTPHPRHEGNCLFSRWPMIGSDTLGMNSYSGNRTVAYRLRIDDDTVVVVNTHLESFRLEMAVKEHYKATLAHPNADSLQQTGSTLARHMATYMQRHGDQIDTIIDYIRPLAGRGMPVLLCGDFNDSPVSYAARRARSVLNDCYRQSGSGMGFTYHEKAMPFRIDHIFASSRFVPLKTWVENSVVESDHYPIIAILDLLPKKNGDASPKTGK